MFTPLRVRFIAIVLITLTALGVALRFKPHPGIDLAGGAELRYKMLYGSDFKGDRRAATREAADVLRRRLEAKLLQEPRVTTRGDDEVLIQLPGVDADGVRDARRLIETAGELELYAAATPELQERFDRDGVEPDGYKVVGKSTRILVEREPVLEGRHIVMAEARPDPGAEGGPWGTAFELDAEGARRFDEAAERLYDRRPRGRIVIVLDGEVRSAPVVNAPAFHGRGQISGGPRK
jgi:preprotein translocase subunit SecD